MPAPPAPGWDENIWAIASEARIAELQSLIPKAYLPADALAIKGVQCQKLKSY